MVDESQKVWTIDFPQMVSTSHQDAEFYFERDQTCVHTLFKRKFSYVSARNYKLAEIEIVRPLDKEVKASGSGKLTAEDIALSEHMKAVQDKPEGEAVDDEEDGEEEEEGHEEDGQEEEADDNDSGKEREIRENQDIGDIEAEMKAMNIEATEIKVEEEKKEEQIEEGEEEEVDWEARQEKRQQMKALKREKLLQKKPKIVTQQTPKIPEETKPEIEKVDENGSGEDSEKETELIKRALKKQYRKKRVFKTNKNHPKQFNDAVKDQMNF